MPDNNLDNNSGKSPDKSNDSPRAMRWYGIGIEFGGVMGLFAYLGYKADEKFDTDPWLMVTGVMFAFIGLMYLTIKESKDI
ncbi:MAG: AtpZ/AtpI family protein [Phycisphaerae bacterium]|nr:AtpZ/AtpI family protein [Phycisphaerae bacterium]